MFQMTLFNTLADGKTRVLKSQNRTAFFKLSNNFTLSGPDNHGTWFAVNNRFYVFSKVKQAVSKFNSKF